MKTAGLVYRLADVPSAAVIRPACWPKVRHASPSAAGAHLRALMRSRTGIAGEVLNCYPCRHCGGWHVGHLKRST